MVVIAAIVTIVKTCFTAGGIGLAGWLFITWLERYNEQHLRRESYSYSLARDGDQNLEGFRARATRLISIFDPGTELSAWRVCLFYHHSGEARFTGTYGLTVRRRVYVHPDGQIDIWWSAEDRHGEVERCVEEGVLNQEDVGWAAVTELLQIVEAYNKWHCDCFAEARFRELRGYARTLLLSPHVIFNVPDEAPPIIHLAHRRIVPELIDETIRHGV